MADYPLSVTVRMSKGLAHRLQGIIHQTDLSQSQVIRALLTRAVTDYEQGRIKERDLIGIVNEDIND